MTMQTKAPLESYRLQNYNRDVLWLTGSAKFDTDQPYQRGHVWGTKRKQNLIRSMFLGCPIGAIIINDRFSARFTEPGYGANRNWAYAIIDGKQRVSAILGFLNDEYVVPSWFPSEWSTATEDTEDGPYVRFSGFSDTARRAFQDIGIAVSEGRFKSLADERRIFDLINFGGVAQGEEDADR